MTTTSIGTIDVRFDAGVLTLTDRQSPKTTLRFETAEIRSLAEFLNHLFLVESNARQAFRIPVSDYSGLTVELHRGDVRVAATPVTISLSGIFVRLPDSGAMTLSVGEEVDVTLHLSALTTTLHGQVSRRDRQGSGILFRSAFQGEQLDPPPDLTKIVMQLQRKHAAGHLGIASP